jgi:hypothetical protein
MWRNARNVTITYKPLPPSAPNGPVRLDDLVSYQGLISDKFKTISGFDTPDGVGAWNWRGNGWLIVASSHWEILGYGGDQGDEQWVVTYFAKTLFTPAGIDFYSKRKEGLSEEILADIKDALSRVNDDVVRKLANTLFVVRSD